MNPTAATMDYCSRRKATASVKKIYANQYISMLLTVMTMTSNVINNNKRHYTTGKVGEGVSCGYCN